ncbi:MAG: carboxypeptidase regulatory-like domain-containing protein [Acidobacteria bacterium]|nr:MAG: carboxypeptidase regulatory-like domain-containing protein [Acidobacteriota bacterium]
MEGVADQIIPTDSGEKSTTLTEKQLQDFTIVGSNAAEFIKILPGFAPRNNGDGLKSGTDFTGEVIGINGNGDGGSQSPLNGAFVANGAGVNNIDITADGAHVSDPGCNCATPVNPNADMIQEFSVLTSNFSAENSKGPIVINSVAKAGGHDFHGLLGFSARDYVLNANRWVNNATGTARPANKFFYPEGQISGPVLFPHSDFNRNRDKLFFSSGFEYFFQTLDTGLLSATVPTANMRTGNFSPAELALLGAKTASGNPPSQLSPCLTTLPTPTTVDSNGNYICGNGNDPTQSHSFWGDEVLTTPGSPTMTVLGTPQASPALAGGIFPASLKNASGLGLLSANVLPLPNADPATTNGYNYVKDIAFDQNSWQWLSRVDYSISDNTKLYVRYNLQKETQQFPIGLWWRNAQQVPYPTPILGKNRSDSISASLTHVFNPTLSNEFVFGYTYIDFPNVFGDSNKVSRKALNIPFAGLFHNGVDQISSLTGWGGEFPTMFNPGGFEAGGSGGLFAKKHLPTVSDNVSKVWGTHTAKFGFFYEFVINNQPNSTYSNGLISEAGWAGGSSGNPYADLLAGFAGQYQETNFSNLHNEGYDTAEFFGMDSWKVTRRLTVDYGMRFSHLGAWYDRQGVGFAVFDPSLYVAGSSNTSGTGFDWNKKNSAVPLSGFPTRALFYAPRFGLAYDLLGTGKTVLRGGWGQYYYHNAQFTQGLDQPVNVELSVQNSLTFGQIETTNVGAQAFGTGAVSLKDDHTPLTTSYSFSISQRLPFASLLEISYVGNQSKFGLNQQGVGTNVNVVPYGTLFNKGFDPSKQNSSGNPSEYAFAPYSIYQEISIANHNLSSNYNAMQVSWVRAKGSFDIALNYTYSKSLGTLNANCCNALDQLNPANDYGAQPFDRRHLFNAAYSIELPRPVHNNKALEGIVNGWQISGITSVQSGVNLTANSANLNFNAASNISSLVTQNQYSSAITPYSINGTDQIALMPILTCNPTQNLGPHQWLNGNCFQIPTVPGKNGPTVLPEFFGPWFWTSDLSLFKNFQIKEGQKLQFRLMGYSFMNHPIWSFSGTGYGANSLYLNFGPNGSGGQTQTNGNFGVAPLKIGNRIIQLALKYYF